MTGDRSQDKAVKPRRALLTSHRPHGRRGARSIWFGVRSANKSKRQWQEALESSNSCFGFSWNNGTYVMRPADNNAQPGTRKNARRMCLRHQTIQYFSFIGTKIEKGKKIKGKKRKKKKASLWNSSSSWTGFLQRGAAKRDGHGPCGEPSTRTAAPQRAQPWGVGARLPPSVCPHCWGHRRTWEPGDTGWLCRRQAGCQGV